MLEAEQIMKRCQIGTRNYEEANNLHAECYRIIGKLLAERTEQEPVAFASHGVINWIADKQFQHEADLYTTPPQRTERNFCPRCGKRTKDIHTCTPPQENT